LSDLAATCRLILDQAQRQGVDLALVGGFAVSVRTEPRFTRDIDVVVSVSDDAEAEAFVGALIADGHELLATVEQEAVGRLATARLRLSDGSLVDLLFASSGIEPEIAAAAEELEVLPGLFVPVITLAHLIAVKVLARDDRTRPQDIADLRSLLETANPDDVDAAYDALRLIVERQYHRERDLTGALDELRRESGSSGP
jgi:hypothetical protein